MKTYFITSLKLTVVFIILCAVVYPLFVAGIAKMAPGRGNGQTVALNGKIVGYANIGQSFTRDDYFWSRPSAVNYNAAGSAGSNKGPSNMEYLQTVQSRIDTFMVHNPAISKDQIPADLVTASASGLDPHISVEAAKVQVKRIARLRNIEEQTLNALIDERIEKPLFTVFGPAKINVLKLNILLDNFNQRTNQ